MAIENLIGLNIVPNAQLYLQIGRFLLVLGAGILITRVFLVPVLTRAAVRRKASKKLIHQMNNIVTILGVFITFSVALQAAEFGDLLTILGTIAAALTVAVGFGMRDQVANLVAGVFIHLDNPFVKGDYVQVGEEEGEIKEINLRSSTLNGHASEEIIVPNSALTNSNVKNYTRGIKTKSSIQFKLSPKKVKPVSEIVIKLAEDDSEVLDTPAPDTLYRKFDEEKMMFELRYWVKDSSDSKRIKSRILEKFNEEAVEKGLFEEEKKEDKN